MAFGFLSIKSCINPKILMPIIIILEPFAAFQLFSQHLKMSVITYVFFIDNTIIELSVVFKFDLKPTLRE